MSRFRLAIRRASLIALVPFLVAGGLGAQVRPDSTARDTLVFLHDPIVVTATRSVREVFRTPAPVAVFDSMRLRRARPNTVTDLFRDVPGMDVNGVGAQQPRPIIRGQRGQRVLLLEDGMRLNNSRRQQDFGEVPALVDVSMLERVEVVRGPASVLYGTDAIGGVVNLISRVPEAEGMHGNASYTYAGAGDRHLGAANLRGRFGAFDVLAAGALRQADAYEAPAGRFGDISLANETLVNRTGIRDRNARLALGWSPSARHRLFVRGEFYDADDGAFGYVDPDAYAPDQPLIDITYPEQRFWKTTVGWQASDLGFALADRVEAMTWLQDNERRLDFDLFTSFGPQAPAGAGVQINTFNNTDLRTIGGRLEARKLVTPAVLLTYGVDFFRDRSENTDSSVTTVVGFGPPQTEVSTTPQVPNATYRSLGGFLQSEFTVTPRFTLIAGARVQEVSADTDPTPGLDESFSAKSNVAVVGAANAIFEVADGLSLVGTVGRAFRSPNLIEWFFDGPTPEGNGYQVRSPDLEPETSFNIDLGLRYRARRIAAEAFVFRNVVYDGIRIAPLGYDVQGFPAFGNVNVDELLFRGIEASAEVALPAGFRAGGGFTWIDTEDRLDPDNPIGDSFSSKVTGMFGYGTPGDRFWAEYAVRHNGERSDVTLSDNPIGDRLPAFTVHDVRAGLTLFRSGAQAHRIAVGIQNLTDVLYAEFSNVSFFRPEPRRSITLTYELAF